MMNQNFIDAINVADFLISLMNLESNTTQNDKQEIEEHVTNQIKSLLDKVNFHLESQDKKIDSILQKLEELQ